MIYALPAVVQQHLLLLWQCYFLEMAVFITKFGMKNKPLPLFETVSQRGNVFRKLQVVKLPIIHLLTDDLTRLNNTSEQAREI